MVFDIKSKKTKKIELIFETSQSAAADRLLPVSLLLWAGVDRKSQVILETIFSKFYNEKEKDQKGRIRFKKEWLVNDLLS